MCSKCGQCARLRKIKGTTEGTHCWLGDTFYGCSNFKSRAKKEPTATGQTPVKAKGEEKCT